jgi:large subunit ribosomal protein L18
MMKKDEKRIRLKAKIKSKIVGKTNLSRLSVFRSNKFIYAQIIDDEKKRTLFSASLKEIKAKNNLSGAGEVGKAIAGKCLKKKISEVVFDRSGYKYHGKIKALAEGARKEGLKF